MRIATASKGKWLLIGERKNEKRPHDGDLLDFDRTQKKLTYVSLNVSELFILSNQSDMLVLDFPWCSLLSTPASEIFAGW
ncbi:hypothetical protein TH59_02870 [Pantoea ananatis]|uniref:hypothetical protein n=1 Tax=Pantoea ananas TaxID=553 RepID=UPI000EB1F8A4|nr:hypothetical protein [Pantoea ananatis]MDC7863899.1 hypothetical protein [Pantoea ananatis]NQE78574.1 hypothetical protein [Pantoea ananatis]NQE82477.1 hypothetical protein [Pantoea ananatis]